MSPLSGRGVATGKNMTDFVYNNLKLSTLDYAKAVEEVAKWHSLPFIDVFGESGINQFNKATYISDNVHPNSEGGKKIAKVVINAFKNLEPLE